MSNPFTEENRGSDQIYYGTTSDSDDVRYQDDQHSTYGMQYTNEEEEQ